GFHLILQFSNRSSAAAGNSLITRSENTANSKRAMQRVNCHQRDCGRAIWIGNETAVLLYVLPIDLRNDQRNVRIHSENRRGVDYDRARFARSRDEPSGGLSARAEKCDVDLVEGVFAEFFHCNWLIAKLNVFPRGSSGREHADVRHRKISPLQNAQQLCADR